MTDSNLDLNHPYSKPQSPQHYQYVSDYNSYAYEPAKTAIPGLPFTQSQAGGSGLYTISNQPSPSYPSNTIQHVSSSSRVKSQSNNFVSSQVKNEQVVKGQSRINYVPYQKKVVEYEDRQYVEKVPIKKKKTKMQQRRVVQTVPKQVTRTQYYAVQKRVEYKKEIIPQKKIQMVPVQKKVKRYQYVPVQKQIVHYPQNVDLQTAKSQSRMVLRDQGINVKGDAEFRPIDPALIYHYSDRPESRLKNIGYVDQGTSRVLSTAPTPHQHYQTYFPPQDYTNTYTTQTTYQTGGNNFTSSNVYSYSPFQNMEESKRQTYIRQSSPQLVVTDPNGGVTEQMAHRQRGSYITELSNINQQKPFQNINQSSRKRPGITQVKRSSGKKFNDYGQQPQRVYDNEEQIKYNQSHNTYDNSNADWRIQK